VSHADSNANINMDAHPKGKATTNVVVVRSTDQRLDLIEHLVDEADTFYPSWGSALFSPTHCKDKRFNKHINKEHRHGWSEADEVKLYDLTCSRVYMDKSFDLSDRQTKYGNELIVVDGLPEESAHESHAIRTLISTSRYRNISVYLGMDRPWSEWPPSSPLVFDRAFIEAGEDVWPIEDIRRMEAMLVPPAMRDCFRPMVFTLPRGCYVVVDREASGVRKLYGYHRTFVFCGITIKELDAVLFVSQGKQSVDGRKEYTGALVLSPRHILAKSGENSLVANEAMTDRGTESRLRSCDTEDRQTLPPYSSQNGSTTQCKVRLGGRVQSGLPWSAKPPPPEEQSPFLQGYRPHK
jgi:hypothetical protein